MKSEPHVYSLQNLQAERDGIGQWDGVRNKQAKNFIKSMNIGDQALFYHSSCPVPGVAGIMKVNELC